jgi:hypothetical protein
LVHDVAAVVGQSAVDVDASLILAARSIPGHTLRVSLKGGEPLAELLEVTPVELAEGQLLECGARWRNWFGSGGRLAEFVERGTLFFGVPNHARRMPHRPDGTVAIPRRSAAGRLIRTAVSA